MKIVLDSDTLSYVNPGTGTLHVRHLTYVRALCGLTLYSSTEPHMSRKLAPEQFCRKCYSVMQHPRYRRMWHVESEATG